MHMRSTQVLPPVAPEPEALLLSGVLDDGDSDVAVDMGALSSPLS